MNIKNIPKALAIVITWAVGATVSGYAISQARTAEKDIDAESKIGWLHGNCLAVKNPRVPKNAELLVVSLDDVQNITPAKVLRPARNGKECPGLLEDRKAVNQESGVTFYRVSSEKAVETAIGVLNEKALTKQELLDLNRRGLDLDNDGHKETFSQCSTSEGVRFSIWNGTAYRSKLIWSGDYYLGYDTEANCPF